MDCDLILKNIAKDRENESVIDLYRYNGLMQAIDFFSSRLSFDQIISSAFEFVNELLTVSRSVMFIQSDKKYILNDSKGFNGKFTEIASGKNLETFAVLCGTVVYGRNRLLEYFEVELLDYYHVQIMIPLIMDTTLAGFIFLSEKTVEDFVANDVIISETLMRLFMNALENNRRLEKLQQVNKELDEKIFNLFAINQSSKVLLTEHNLDTLYELSLDVFSELTLSSRTGFFLYDEGAEKFVIKAYKDIYQSVVPKGSIAFTPNAAAYIDPMCFLVDTRKPSDIKYFNLLFNEKIDILNPLKPLYIILLIKQSEILGFVCLGETVSGLPYKDSMFELVESLAAYTYIALSNAILLKKLEEHKRLLQEKLDRLMSLNRLMKNINSAEDLNTLQQLIMHTLEVSFGVKKGALALYKPQEQALVIAAETGVQFNSGIIILNSYWNRLYNGSIVLETDEDKVYHYLGEEMDRVLGKKSGLLAVPVYLEKCETVLLGAVLVFQFRNGFLSDEENLVVMESVANLSAPILNNFISLEEERRVLTVNYKEAFLRELKKQVVDCRALNTPLEVIHIKSDTALFCDNGLAEALTKELKNVYPITHDHIIILAAQDFQYYRHEALEIAGQYGANATIYEMGKDFQKDSDFLDHFIG